MTPSDHMSAFVVYPCLLITSGAASERPQQVQRAAGIIQLLVGEDELRQTEVSDLDVEQRVLAENVLRLRVSSVRQTHLDVAVDDSHAVEVTETVRQRVDDAERLLLRENRVTADAIEELAATQQLHHDVDVLQLVPTRHAHVLALERVDQLHNVLVLHQR